MAESFPTTFHGRSVNEQFKSIHKSIQSYLPLPKVDTPLGLRTVYSTHPKGAMASMPLRRQEAPNFQPWMANIHTIAVDFDWFETPQDAVERNEAFLHTVSDATSAAATVSVPVFKPAPVRAYAGARPQSRSEILAAIESEFPQERVAGARAALIQDLKLPAEKQARLLCDAEGDAVWFGTEIALRDSAEVGIQSVVNLLGQQDDYLVGVGAQLLAQSRVTVDDLCGHLTEQPEISQNSVVVARTIAEQDWDKLKELPAGIAARSFQEWFEKAWVVCGASLCLAHWRYDLRAVFHTAYQRAGSYDAGETERTEKTRQLELLFQLLNTRSRKQIQDEPLFQAADELIAYGRNLRPIVLRMLDNGNAAASNGATRFLTRLWWDDAVDLLIRQLDASSSRRRCARRALVDVGEPAVGANRSDSTGP